MKKILKKMLAFMLVPSFLFASGCDLFNKNDDGNEDPETEVQEQTESQEEMFDKYLSAVSKTKSSDEYTIISSDEDFDGVFKEITITKKENEHHLTERQASQWSKTSMVKVDEDYIHYNDNSWSGKTSYYMTESDFNAEIGILAKNELVEFKTIAGIKNYVTETVVTSFCTGCTSEDYISIEKAFEIEKTNDVYVLTVSTEAVLDLESEKAPEVDAENIKFKFTMKVYFGEKINRMYSEFCYDVRHKGKDYNYKAVEEMKLTYEFDPTLAITDFSSYPTPEN